MNCNEPVKYWEYLPSYIRNRQEILKITDEVFSSGRLILGSRVESFERHFARFCGAEYGIGVNSCTDALFLAMKALNLGAGDEVITVANTAVPTVAAIRATGATPVFADVDPDSYLMDTSQLEGLVTGRTRCIIPVHLCGQAVDMETVLAVAVRNRLSVIEDCAQAAGATFKGQRVGSIGDIGAFSFYPTKILGAFGDAGMLTTSSRDLADRLKRLRFYGMNGEYYAEEEGFNSRIDELQAALLEFMMNGLDEEVRKRAIVADTYTRELAGIEGLGLPVTHSGRDHRYYLYTIKTADRDRLKLHLEAHGIETRINYPYPIHLMRGYAFLGYQKGDLPVTEKLAGEILSLPMYGELQPPHVARVIDSVKSFFRGV